MACGCKNKQASAGASSVVKTASPSVQESKPEKNVGTKRIIKREIR